MHSDPSRLISGKIAESWGSVVGEKGYGDPYEVAQRLYDALHHPAEVVRGIQERMPAGAKAPALWERTRRALEAPVDLPPAPDRGDFVRTVAETIVRDVPVAQTLLPGAREQVHGLASRGMQVVPWSAGYPDHQHHKLGAVGLVDPSIAASVRPPLEVSRDFGEPIQVATAIAPDKTTAENMQKVADIARDSALVVVDDRTKNLMAFGRTFPDAPAIWVQYGAHAKNSVAKLRNGEAPEVRSAIDDHKIIPIADIAGLTPAIERLQESGRLPRNGRITLAMDIDDTLLNNDARRDLQHQVTHRVLAGRGWVPDPADAPAARQAPAADREAGRTAAGAATPAPAGGPGAATAAVPGLGSAADAARRRPKDRPQPGSAASSPEGAGSPRPRIERGRDSGHQR